MTPIYLEELALSRFIEEYLDFMIPEVYKQYNGYAETGDKSVSASTKVLNDIVMIMETDRVLIKTFNALIALCIYPNREKIAVELETDNALQFRMD